MKENKINEALSIASERYAEITSLRAGVQVIPYVGGALDTLFSGKGAEIQKERMNDVLNNLSDRLKNIENVKPVEAGEEFYDLSLSVFEGVVRSRSKEKRERFASILINQLVNESEWDEAETATRLLSSLEDIHIEVLMFAQTAPMCTGVFSGKKVVSLVDKKAETEDEIIPLNLLTHFNTYTVGSLSMVCSELISKGLLYDEGIGRLSTKSLDYFVTTNLTDWFLLWISNNNG